jgi:hypothetical protein
MRVEYQTKDGLRVYGELDTLKMGDRIEKPIPLNWDETKYHSCDDCPPEISTPMLTRSYRVIGFETVAILEEIF